jgi:hypothetical protein
MSTGAPVPDRNPGSARYGAPPGRPTQIAARAQQYAVAIYTSKEGDACARAGRLRGRSLGLTENGVFRPYTPGHTGACGDPRRSWIDGVSVDGRQLVFGRAAPEVAWVRLGRERVRPGLGGAFLFVRGGPPRAFPVQFE